MQSVFHLVAPLALAVPGIAAVEAIPDAGLTVRAAPMSRPPLATEHPFSSMAESHRTPDRAEQVRIEQRITVRVSPRPAPAPVMPSALGDEVPGGDPRFIEKKIGKCLPVGAIAGVQPQGGNKLVLFMRDRRLVSATLDKSCQGRDFYSGFLVARNEDGMLCTGRDELLSRTGAKCKVSGLRQLIEVDD